MWPQKASVINFREKLQILLGRVMFGQQQSWGGYQNSTAYKTSSHYLWCDEGGNNTESSSFKEYLITNTNINTKARGSASNTTNYTDLKIQVFHKLYPPGLIGDVRPRT